MRTSAIIEGLTILEKYREKPDGFNCGAGHDVLYVYSTDKPVESDDLNRLVELGWFQEECHHKYQDDEETDGSFAAKHYDPDEGWTCYT